MFKVKSFILFLGKTITDLRHANDNPNEYFIEIKKKNEILPIKNQLDFDHIEGAIYLTYREQVIMDFTMWDLVDQLWAYFLNLIKDVIETGKAPLPFRGH